PLHEIVPRHRAVVGIAKAHDGLHALGGAAVAPVLGTPASVVARLQSGLPLLGAQRLELGRRGPAMIGAAVGEHLVDDLAIAVEALRLVVRTLVRIEAEPGHAVEDGLDRLLRGSLQVGVLDPQHEGALVMPGIGPGEERGAGPADVEVTRRAGGEAGAHGATLRGALPRTGSGVRHGSEL